jgi:uncharacterized protein YegL
VLLTTDLHPPRVLPVVMIADTSGSMAEHGKLEALNLAMREMLRSLSQHSVPDADVHVAVVSCGGSAAVIHRPLSSIADASWVDLEARGSTPMGAALDLVSTMLQVDALPSNAYSPSVILIADGHSTDDFVSAMARFDGSECGDRASRLAIAIGPDADTDELARFAGGAVAVLAASDAADIEAHVAYALSAVASRLQAASAGHTDMIGLAPERGDNESDR